MHRILAIAENTFKEALRQRIFLILVVFSIILLVLSIFLEPFAIGESPKILRDFGLAITQLFGVLIVIIIGSTLIHKDIEKRTIYTVITKPIKRSEIIIGKFLGLFLLIAILECSMLAIHQLVIFIYERSFDFPLLLSLPFSLLEIMVLLGILLLLSSFVSPTLSALFGIIFFVIGHAIPSLKLFAEQLKTPGLRYCTHVFYYALPNLENFNMRLELVYKLPLHANQLLFSICYGLIYTIFLLYITTIIFENKQFK
jgi:ABC-type transport system involved in multi-copper enzyme maturation permease subunit